MTLQTFLAQSERTKKLPELAVICFSGKTCPLLFFYHIFSFFKKHDVPIDHLSCVSNDVASIKAFLSTISLNGSMTYWLESFHILSAKKQQELLAYLKTYTGPHTILLFCEDVMVLPSSRAEVITVPDTIAPHEFSMVRFLINEASSQANSAFAQQIARYTDHLSLDSACLFAHYEVVVGRTFTDFFSQWTVHLVEPTSSLFILSQHFFSKKHSPFFRQWASLAQLYMPSFWAAFWADQIWRAYILCDLMKKKKYADAKKAQYKLPFSFINRDWSLYSASELRNAHQFLSVLDFRLKNGGSEIGLEHFYTQFFDNKFR